MANAEETYSELENSTSISEPGGDAVADSYNTEVGISADVQVLMHSPMGIRIALNISQSRLELWISPQARKSVHYGLRNFSNRDDHTRIFDRIALPDLSPAEYRGCDYDPFHSVLHYADQRVHVIALAEHPGVLLWFESEAIVDFKSDKADTPRERTGARFVTLHPDRGHMLEFAAVAGPDGGAFRHQRSVDRGRSTYARLSLRPGQPLLIGGEMLWERPAEEFAPLAALPVDELDARNEAAVERHTAPGRVAFRDRPDWQEQYELNKRIMLSCADYGGAIPAALRSLYYLIWHMDGALTAVHAAHCGWPEYLERWTRFELSNPTETEGPVPGRYYGQLVNGRISKQEEWGTYFAAWSAFAHWTRTGSREFAGGRYLENLLSSLDWLERNCWEPDCGAFGTWYRGENPVKGSYDYGWDEAVGCPQSTSAPSFQGKAITRIYGFQANVMAYNTYLMLAAMMDGDGAEELVRKARGLRPFLEECRSEPRFSAIYELEDGSTARDPKPPHYPPGACFVPDPTDVPELVRNSPRYDLTSVKEGQERFVHQMLNCIVAQDPAHFGSGNLEDFLDLYLPQVRRAGRFLQMAGAPIEDVNCPDGSYHDNRPQLFAAALMQVAMVSRALYPLPFGLALRSNHLIAGIEGYRYRGSTITFRFEGDGPIGGVDVDGRELPNSLQVPDDRLEDGGQVRVRMGEEAEREPRLVWSTVRLRDVERRDESVLYHVEA